MLKFLLMLLLILFSGSAAVFSQNVKNAAETNLSNSSVTNDPIEKEYQKLLDEDDAAQAEVDEWIKQAYQQPDSTNSFPINQATLKLKIEQRLDTVRKAYEAFLKKYPDHTKARVAYASFLSDIGKEEESRQQLEIAKEKDPKNPAVWNNLANYYGHNDSPTNAFFHYQKAIELNPSEPVYYRNFATTVYMFREEAMQYFKISEEQAIKKAMSLYKRALELDPKNFLTASDLAQTYYGFKLPRINVSEIKTNRQIQTIADEAISAWKDAEKLARDDMEKQGCQIHIARWQIYSARLSEARKTLEPISIESYQTTKETLLKILESMEQELRKKEGDEKSQ